MNTAISIPKNHLKEIKRELDNDSLIHFCDVLAPSQNMTFQPGDYRQEMDEQRRVSNRNLFDFLKDKYGEKYVMMESVNFNDEGYADDVPGMIGFYVNAVAFEFAHSLDGLPIFEADKINN